MLKLSYLRLTSIGAAAIAAIACSSSGGASSQLVGCTEPAHCDAFEAAVDCVDGYCVDEGGTRITIGGGAGGSSSGGTGRGGSAQGGSGATNDGGTGQGGTSGGGTSTGGTSTGGSGGTVVTSPGTVSLEFTVEDQGAYCVQSDTCSGPPRIGIRDASGAYVNIYPSECATMHCGECTERPCPGLACNISGFAVDGASLTWDGSVYDQVLDGCGVGTPCEAHRYAVPGTYTAEFCARRGTLVPVIETGSSQCVYAADAECASVAFDFPAAGTVTGVISGAESCRTQADCSTARICRAPDYVEPPCRGIACPTDECFDDGACALGSVCSWTRDDFCSDVIRTCQPVCSGDAGGSCFFGFSCDATGHCLRDDHCALGSACPDHTTCTPGSSSPDGCVRNACATDADCGGGVCVLGGCYAGLGACLAAPEPCLAP